MSAVADCFKLQDQFGANLGLGPDESGPAAFSSAGG